MELKTLDAEDLARVLRKTRRVVMRDRRTHPERLPPEARRVGREPLWIESDVEAWLRGESLPNPAEATEPATVEVRRRGRPRRTPGAKSVSGVAQ